MKRLGILLLDERNDGWSARNRCLAIKKHVVSHHFEVYGAFGEDGIIDKIEEKAKNFDFVHIQFTGEIDRMYNFYKKHPEKTLITVINERSIYDGFEVDTSKLSEMVIGCAGATALSPKVASSYKIDFIPNGVDLGVMKNPHKQAIGYIGCSGDNKGFPTLEEVCKDLGLHLHSLIYQKNQVPHEKMWEEYRKINVLVHPTLTEACSNVVLEALSMNVPVITTRTGCWELYKDYLTIIEPTYDSLYRELKKYIGRSIIEKQFQWAQICQQYERFYERAYFRQQEMIRCKKCQFQL